MVRTNVILFFHAGVEPGDEAHRDPQDLSNQGAAPLGGSIGWLRIRRSRTGSTATGHPTSTESYQIEIH
jgi:hypothetical protein